MMALKLNASAAYSLQNLCHKPQNSRMSFKPNRTRQNAPKTFFTMNMAANQSNDPTKLSIGRIADKARDLWDNSPQPVRSFPWNKASDNFIQLILDLALEVVKYLSVPLFVITSISEMSYCAHERKLYVIPIPFLVGVAVAGVLRDAALESSPYLKKAEIPWHLIAVAIFFSLLKFLGPYYPYWGRILIPHFANGALWRTLWFMFIWYRKPMKTSETKQPDVMVDSREADGAQ